MEIPKSADYQRTITPLIGEISKLSRGLSKQVDWLMSGDVRQGRMIITGKETAESLLVRAAERFSSIKDNDFFYDMYFRYLSRKCRTLLREHPELRQPQSIPASSQR